MFRWKQQMEFQLTASQGGWPRISGKSLKSSNISTHSLTRRLTLSLNIVSKECFDFNSQPHKEADLSSGVVPNHVLPISTHSLTRRLTARTDIICVRLNISTHSLTRRLTIERMVIDNGIFKFQLTASQGGWHLHYLLLGFKRIFQLTASQGGWRFL